MSVFNDRTQEDNKNNEVREVYNNKNDNKDNKNNHNKDNKYTKHSNSNMNKYNSEQKNKKFNNHNHNYNTKNNNNNNSSMHSDISDNSFSSERYNPQDLEDILLKESLLSGSEKVYSIDTNVLILDPLAIYHLADVSVPKDLYDRIGDFGLVHENNNKRNKQDKPNNIVLSDIIFQELDHIKDNYKMQSYVRYLAGSAINVIKYIYEKGEELGKMPYEGIPLDDQANFIVYRHDEIAFNRYFERYPYKDNDLRILFDLKSLLTKSFFPKNKSLILVSEDKGMRIKSNTTGLKIKIEDYKRENIGEYDKIFSGKLTVNVDDDLFKEYVENIKKKGEEKKNYLKSLIDKLDINKASLYPNEIICLDNSGFDSLNKDVEPELRYLRVSQDRSILVEMNNFKRYMNDVFGSYSQEENNKDSSEKYLDNVVRNLELYTKKVNKFVDSSTKKKEQVKEFLNYSSSLFDTLIALMDSHYDKEYPIKKQLKSNKDLPVTTSELLERRTFNKDLIPVNDQIPYFDILLNEDIPIVSVIGEQGSGKSIFALLAGLYGVLNNSYERVSVIRSSKEIGGESFGYLPGSESDKMDPWKRSVRENLFEIYSPDFESVKGNLAEKRNIEAFIKELEDQGVIEYLSPQFLQGRTLSNRYIIVDEAQNFPKVVIRLLIGRTGRNSKIVLLGDPKQLDVIYDRNVNQFNSGIAHVANSLKDNSLAAHITLKEYVSYRSKAADQAKYIK